MRYIPGVMKTGSANLNFLCNFSQLPQCLILACLLCSLRLLSVFFVFIGYFLVRDLFSSGCRYNYFPSPPYPTRPAPLVLGCAMLPNVGHCWAMLQYVALCCLCCAILPSIALCCAMLPYIALCLLMLPYVALCCTVLPYIAL